MFSLRSIFSSSHDNVPLSEMDILEVSPTQDGTDLPEKFEGRVINVEYILRTGNIPVYSGVKKGEIVISEDPVSPEYTWSTDITINLEVNDTLTRKLAEVEEACAQLINKSSELPDLSGETPWSPEDKVTWERVVSNMVAQKFNEVPGLEDYRAASGNSDLIRVKSLNEFSVEIDNAEKAKNEGREYQPTMQYCCKEMPLESFVLQQLEDRFLPETAPEGDSMVRKNYFRVSGMANFYPGYFDVRCHSCTISSDTGNVIDWTSDNDVYCENINPDYSFSDFVHGKLAICKDGSIYSGETFLSVDGKVATYRVESGQIDLSGLYDGISAKWSEAGIEDNGSEGKLVAVVDLASPDQVTEDGASDPPPEVQALAEIKKGIERLQKIKEAGVINDRYPYDIRIESMRNRFDKQVDDMVKNGSIYDVLKFLDDAGLVDKSSGKVEILSNAPTVTAAVSQVGRLYLENVISVSKFTESF